MNETCCPFCASREGGVVHRITGPKLGHFVRCDACGCQGPVKETPEDAKAAWARADIAETVNAAWRRANLLGIDLAEERVVSGARERANVAARERILELEAQVLSLTAQLAGGKGP